MEAMRGSDKLAVAVATRAVDAGLVSTAAGVVNKLGIGRVCLSENVALSDLDDRRDTTKREPRCTNVAQVGLRWIGGMASDSQPQHGDER